MQEFKLKKYELMWIVGGNIDDSFADQSMNRIRELLSIADESKVLTTSLWARRKLAYPIENFEEGTYFVFDLECFPASIIKIENILKNDSQVIRHLITLKEKFKPYKVRSK
jgi:small subunit ribosomal protein S6|tara:strand:+ start:18506 stop:18838 length:333 start_codon:yes stop_codon:yes gene_type:complete